MATDNPLFRAAQKLEEAERLRQSGELQRSKRLCESLLKEHPNYLGAIHTLGLVHADLKDLDSASAYLSKAAMLCPKDWRVLTALSGVSAEMGRQNAAAFALEQAQRLKEDSPVIVGTLAEVYRKDKEYELAADFFERYLATETPSPGAKLMLGDCYEQLGRARDAAALYESALSEPSLRRAAFARLVSLPNEIAPATEDIASDDPSIVEGTDGRTSHFVKAAVLHRKKQYRDAWAELVAANAKKREQVAESDAERTERRSVLEFAKTFEAPTTHPGEGLPVSLFILGPSRSGKTTAEYVVSRLPGVKRGYENPIVEHAVQTALQISGYLPSRTINAMPPGLDGRFLQFYREDLAKRADGARVFTNTYPAKIVEVLRYATAIPGARFIFVRRNLEDIVFRIFSKSYQSGNAYAYDLKSIRSYVEWYYELEEIYLKKLPHVTAVVDYDDFVAAPVELWRIAADLCGLEVPDEDPPDVGDDRGVSEPYRAFLRAG